jgi:tripartite-type tricarboxylate transporter receptor subunit TctC
MKLPRRNFLHLAAGAAALPTLSRIAWTESYPSRPVRWIVSFAAGGPNDIVARIVGQYLSDHLGQQFVIENRAGAAGNVGMQSALNSEPDGYTIAFVGPNYAINPGLYEKLPFDFIRDSVPVAGIMRLANVMDVNPTFPANNLTEFIAYAKANPGKINFGSGGVGTSPHLSGELLKTMAGINLVHGRTAARPPRSPTSSPVRCKWYSITFPVRSGTLRQARCARWASPRRNAWLRFQMWRPSAKPCLATR